MRLDLRISSIMCKWEILAYVILDTPIMMCPSKSEHIDLYINHIQWGPVNTGLGEIEIQRLMGEKREMKVTENRMEWIGLLTTFT